MFAYKWLTPTADRWLRDKNGILLHVSVAHTGSIIWEESYLALELLCSSKISMTIPSLCSSGPAGSVSRGLPTPLVFWAPQIISEDVAKKTCEDHQLCVVAVLPHILDTGMASGGLPSVTSVLPALRTLGRWNCFTISFLFTCKIFVCLNQELQAEILTWKFF